MKELFVWEGKAVCPNCHGLIRKEKEKYKCNDCKKSYIPYEKGYTEHGVIVEEKVNDQKRSY